MSRNDYNFYPHKLPQVDDLVVAKVTKIDTLLIYVELLEYNNIQATVMLKELTKNKKIKSLRKIVKLDNQEVLKVTNIDPTGNYIDLSRNLVSAAEKEQHLNYYYQGTVIHSIVTYLSIQTGETIRDIYEKYIHPLYPTTDDKDDSTMSLDNPVYLMLEAALQDIDTVFKDEKYLPIKNHLQFIIGRKFQNQINEYRATFQLKFFSPEGNGLQNLKDALTINLESVRAELEKSDERMENVKVSSEELITNCPQYELVLHANRLGEDILEAALKQIQSKAKNAIFQIVHKPEMKRHSGKQKIALMGHGNTV